MKRKAMAALAALALLCGQAATAQPQPAPDSVDTLARDVARLESLRAVKDVQRRYTHLAQSGQWAAMAALFGAQGRIIWGGQTIQGPVAIAQWLKTHSARPDLTPGALNAEFIDDPLINLSADGQSALGRWRGLAFRGDGKGKAWMEGGLYENRYARVGGRWTIAELHYYPEYGGSYATGWSNVGGADLPIVPYHFTHEEVGVPIPAAPGPAPKSGVALSALAGRIAAMNGEDDVRNLQASYGYYVDRKMWDDVVDLFADDGVVEIAGVGSFKGKAGVRKAMERMGAAGLSHGQLNDHPQFDTMVQMLPGGHAALARGTELAMIGEADKGTAHWEINVFRNRFVQEGGLWKISEMHVRPIMQADYKNGWGNGGTLGKARAALPPLLAANAVTPPAKPAELSDLRRRYLRALAYDGTVNVSAAYGYYLDDFQWPGMSGIFATKGNKQSPFAGYYFGRDRIAGAATAMYGATPDPATVKRAGIALHWRIQPVIHVSHDGRSTLLRTVLFHPNTGKYDPASGEPNKRNTIQTGMYPNDQIVLEDGVWRMWTLTIDEPYYVMPNWQGGWSAAKEPAAGGGMRPSPLLQRYPPDLLLTALGKREEGFAGGTGTKIDWPGILPMWFHYRNPVSGRAPALYWPDCVPCVVRPEVSMTRNGYQMPPTGPQVDGVELP